MRKRKYRHPPIVEVVCEFQFAPSSAWDATVPGRIYERLKGDFPLHRPVRRVGIEVEMRPETFAFSPQIEEGVRFIRKDERAFVQVHPHRISVHHLAPYPHWEGFKPLIHKGFQAYTDMVPDASLQRAGLRYINRISVPKGSQFSTYFTLYPHAENELQHFSAFAVFLLLPFEQERDMLHLRLICENANDDGKQVVLLDLDYFSVHLEDVHAMEWVERAHTHILETFENTITDRLRQQFGEEV